MAIQRTRGIILKREDVRETSVALVAYTRDFGKIKLLSKGVRGPGHRFLSAYELFALDDIVFYERKRKGFCLLSQSELVDYFPKVRESLERLSYAAYLIELTEAVTPFGEENSAFYDLLEAALGFLSSEASPKRVARVFEIKLLSHLGFMPRLKTCANCNKPIGKTGVRFSFSMGGVLCEDCIRADKNARLVLAGTINFISHIENLSFDKIRHVKVAKRVGGEVEKLLRSFLRYHLDVRLKSMEFLAKLGM